MEPSYEALQDGSTELKDRGYEIVHAGQVEIFLEQREVAFLSTSKIWENLNFSTEIQILCKFCWVIRMQPLSVLKLFLLNIWETLLCS